MKNKEVHSPLIIFSGPLGFGVYGLSSCFVNKQPLLCFYFTKGNIFIDFNECESVLVHVHASMFGTFCGSN